MIKHDKCAEFEARIVELEAENAKLRECVERYSRIRDYDISGDARQVLKELDEE
jgi:hypothetical protein